ncbi:MAG: 6-carboxyhexanoate--CoA ligase [Thermodesulfovibrionales bacterium]|nr:6-carboxyhexanoate--CoA ligase [Thermodesulfovibrionales bacterium]
MNPSLWNVRMRASQQRDYQEFHISGAEGIYEEKDIKKVLEKYLIKASQHPRGAVDKIYFTLEKLKENPIQVEILNIKTQVFSSPQEAKQFVRDSLKKLNISDLAIDKAFEVLDAHRTMRGAAILTCRDAIRLDPDMERGVRVSRLGIEKQSLRRLTNRLSKLKINNNRVKEAIILASKVANYKKIVAEICISDDPDYTTGYLASREIGYLRITNIKEIGSLRGGRVFFTEENVNIDDLIRYLEKTPVWVTV